MIDAHRRVWIQTLTLAIVDSTDSMALRVMPFRKTGSGLLLHTASITTMATVDAKLKRAPVTSQNHQWIVCRRASDESERDLSSHNLQSFPPVELNFCARVVALRSPFHQLGQLLSFDLSLAVEHDAQGQWQMEYA